VAQYTHKYLCFNIPNHKSEIHSSYILEFFVSPGIQGYADNKTVKTPVN
jgi:hypothetical protein